MARSLFKGSLSDNLSIFTKDDLTLFTLLNVTQLADVFQVRYVGFVYRSPAVSMYLFFFLCVCFKFWTIL